jgi:hypothetical protein
LKDGPSPPRSLSEGSIPTDPQRGLGTDCCPRVAASGCRDDNLRVLGFSPASPTPLGPSTNVHYGGISATRRALCNRLFRIPSNWYIEKISIAPVQDNPDTEKKHGSGVTQTSGGTPDSAGICRTFGFQNFQHTYKYRLCNRVWAPARGLKMKSEISSTLGSTELSFPTKVISMVFYGVLSFYVALVYTYRG